MADVVSAKVDKSAKMFEARAKMREKLGGKMDIFVEKLDRWAVSESPSTLVGAILGIIFLISLLIYAIVLAVVLANSPPVETSLLESTSRKIYPLTVRCAGLAEQAREVQANYEYASSFDAGPTGGECYDCDPYGYPSGGTPDGFGGPSGGPSGGGGGFYCPDGSFVSGPEYCCVYTDCPSPTGTECPDLYYGSFCYYNPTGCSGCFYTIYSESCANIVWQSCTKRGVDGIVKANATDPFGGVTTDTCKVTLTYKPGSLCYKKDFQKAKDTQEIIIKKNEEQIINICQIRPNKDSFFIDASNTTKVIIKGTDSDYELFPTASNKIDILLNRLRQENIVEKTTSELWYGFQLSTTPLDPPAARLNFRLSPLFDVLIAASAFSWLGWIGTISGMSNIFGTVYGIVLAVLLATVFKKYAQAEELEKRMSRQSEMMERMSVKNSEELSDVKTENKGSYESNTTPTPTAYSNTTPTTDNNNNTTTNQ